MSKFKVGDKVVVAGGHGLSKRDLLSLGVVPDETVVTIGRIWGGRALLDEFAGADVWTDYCGISLTGLTLVTPTQQKRAELKAALELVQSYNIIITGGQAAAYYNPVYTYNILGSGDAWGSLDGMVNHLLPLESPQQKKLKELEKQQLEIVAKMEQLRSEL